MELLKIENIGLIYQSEDSETAALENISFSVNEGEFIAIVGPSGCGKTTILSLIAGLIKNHFPSPLSGGMRQRVALIRTLAFRPKLLLLDEPFSALDFQTRLHVHDDISSIIANEHKTVLLVTHDISEAIALSDRIIVLSPRPGKIKADIPVRLGTKKPRENRDSPLSPALFEKIWKEVSS